MSLTYSQHPALLALLITTVALVAWWGYRRTVPALSAGTRAFLTALRFGSMALLAFLLAEPLLRRVTTDQVRPTVALLIDSSRSMAPDEGADPAGSTDANAAADEARATAAALTGAMPEVSWKTYRFGTDVLELQAGDSLRFDGSRTDLARALATVSAGTPGNAPAAVVLVSDGRSNTGASPILAADRSPQPIFTITVGDTTRRADVLVGRVLTNDLAYRNVEIPFEVGVRHEGFGNRRVTVALQAGGEVLDRVQMSLPPVDGETTVRLSTTPTGSGTIRYTVSVTRLEDERTWLNNEMSTSVQVLDARKSVLVLAPAPSPDLAALRSTLQSDPDLDVQTRVQRRPSGYYEGPLPDPAEFDLLVLAGFPGPGASSADVDRVEQAARAGTPVLFILERITDQGALARLPSALPALPRAVRTTFTEAAFVPTPEGRRHPMLEFPTPVAPDPLSLLPPLMTSDSDWQAAPDAVVLASPRIRSVLLPDPLLVVRRRSGARTAAILGPGLWRWRNLPEGLDGASGVYADLIDAAVRWLSAPEDDRPVRVRPTRRTFDGTEPIRFEAQVYDEAAQPVSDAIVEVQIALPDGGVLPVTLDPVGNGQFTGDAGRLANGEFAYTAVARRDGASLGEDRGTFAVEQLTLEFVDTRSDPALMRAVAERSGGAVLSADGSDVRAALSSRGLLDPREVRRETASRLWHTSALLFVVIALLTTEWLTRKRKGLV